jgi:hypothetical protein
MPAVVMPAAPRQPLHRAILRRRSRFRCRCRRGRWRRDLPCSRTSSLTTGQAMRSTPRAAGSFSSSHWVTAATPPSRAGPPACRLSPSRSARPAIHGRSERPTTLAVVSAQASLPACRTGSRPRYLLGNMTSCSPSRPLSSQFRHPFRCESRPGRYIRRLYAAHERNLGCVARQAVPMCRASSGARHGRDRPLLRSRRIVRCCLGRTVDPSKESVNSGASLPVGSADTHKSWAEDLFWFDPRLVHYYQ